jgi:ribose transport system ATP-binding protein
MKVLSGAYRKDAGEIYIDDELVEIHGPAHAISLGISAIYQELNLAPDLSVMENLLLGQEPLFGLRQLVDFRRMRRRAEDIIQEVGGDFPPDVPVSTLSVAQRQLVEIGRAISLGGKILILDEPCAALSQREVTRLFELLRQMKSQGKAIIFISHRMAEIREICDVATVLRDGHNVGTVEVRETPVETIIEMMVGKTIEEYFPRSEAALGEEVLRVENLCHGASVRDVSFSLRRGEVLGLAGLVGAGRTELAKCLFGAELKDSGRVFVNGEEVEISSPQKAIAAGMSLVAEDRKEEGLLLNMSVDNNITIANLFRMGSRLLLNRREEKEASRQSVKTLDIRTPDISHPVASLSGGNQQKVILARWLLTKPAVMILDEPTRGIDVGAKTEVYKIIKRLSEKGVAFLLISSEFPELTGICHRIMVMSKGKIVATLDRREADLRRILALAMGQT